MAHLEALRATAMLAHAVIVRTSGQPPTVYDVEPFIAPRQTPLTNGSLRLQRTSYHRAR